MFYFCIHYFLYITFVFYWIFTYYILFIWRWGHFSFRLDGIPAFVGFYAIDNQNDKHPTCREQAKQDTKHLLLWSLYVH